MKTALVVVCAVAMSLPISVSAAGPETDANSWVDTLPENVATFQDHVNTQLQSNGSEERVQLSAPDKADLENLAFERHGFEGFLRFAETYGRLVRQSPVQEQ